MDDIAPPLGAVPSVGRVRAKVLRRCSTKAETSITENHNTQKQKTRWVIFQQALGGGSTDEDSPSSLKANQETSRVISFGLSGKWQLHFDSCKDPQNWMQAMPTFVLVKRGKEMDRVVGAKKDELEKKIQKHRAS
ncbi:hypothetical protein ACOSP7_028996 [Xanthoceras sorbifolium]